MDPKEMKERLAALGPERLAAELLAAADRDDSLARRLELLARESDPDSLATQVRRRIAGLRRASRFVHYRESFGFARDLAEIVVAIESRVLPEAPATAFELADAFLSTEGCVLDRVDDSSGAVGEVFCDACRCWLKAAAAAGDEILDETPDGDRVELLRSRAVESDYGVRDPLLVEADLLLSEEELRRLAQGFETRARPGPQARSDTAGGAEPGDDAGAGPQQRDPGGRALDRDRSSACIHLSMVAEALEDPVLYERAITLLSGSVNELQMVDVARHYLEYGQPDEAVARLEGIAGGRGTDALSLLAEAHGRLGQTERQADCLWRLFERTSSARVFAELLEILPEDELAAARARARSVALEERSVLQAADFLLQAGFEEDAERLLLERHDEVRDAPHHYNQVLPVAERARERGRPGIEMACLRWLLLDILEDGRSRAYGHAARYLRRLEGLDDEIDDYGPLPDHEAFVASIQEDHGRKRSFWRRME